MSVRAMNWLSAIDPKKTHSGTFRVLFYLCYHHNKDAAPEKACFPGQETLREKTGLANSTLNTNLANLEEAGLIKRIRSTIPGTPIQRTYFVLGCDLCEHEKQLVENLRAEDALLTEKENRQTPEGGTKANSATQDLENKHTRPDKSADSGWQAGKLLSNRDETKKKKNKGLCVS